jgi:hypothetical protein
METSAERVDRFEGSRRKNASLALGSAALSLLIGWIAVRKGDVFPVIAAIFMAISSTFTAYQAIRRLPILSLDSEGFQLATGIATKKFRWQECTEFHPCGFLRFGATTIGFLRNGADERIVNLFTARTEHLCEVLSEWQGRYSRFRGGSAGQ